jgi:hypothetical protein
VNCPKHPNVKLICPCCRAAEGGNARAAKHTPAELKKWGRKGGRPRKEVKA